MSSPEIRFYHLTATALENALPQLMEKALEAGMRVLIKVGDEAEAQRIQTALWGYRKADSFLACGIAGSAKDAAQPVLISPTLTRANNADLLCVVDGSAIDDFTGFTRCFDIFDGRDDALTQAARERWKAYKSRSLTLQYWQQGDDGRWSKKG